MSTDITITDVDVSILHAAHAMIDTLKDLNVPDADEVLAGLDDLLDRCHRELSWEENVNAYPHPDQGSLVERLEEYGVEA